MSPLRPHRRQFRRRTYERAREINIRRALSPRRDAARFLHGWPDDCSLSRLSHIYCGLFIFVSRQIYARKVIQSELNKGARARVGTALGLCCHVALRNFTGRRRLSRGQSTLIDRRYCCNNNSRGTPRTCVTICCTAVRYKIQHQPTNFPYNSRSQLHRIQVNLIHSLTCHQLYCAWRYCFDKPAMP